MFQSLKKDVGLNGHARLLFEGSSGPRPGDATPGRCIRQGSLVTVVAILILDFQADAGEGLAWGLI